MVILKGAELLLRLQGYNCSRTQEVKRRKNRGSWFADCGRSLRPL